MRGIANGEFGDFHSSAQVFSVALDGQMHNSPRPAFMLASLCFLSSSLHHHSQHIHYDGHTYQQYLQTNKSRTETSRPATSCTCSSQSSPASHQSGKAHSYPSLRLFVHLQQPATKTLSMISMTLTVSRTTGGWRGLAQRPSFAYGVRSLVASGGSG